MGGAPFTTRGGLAAGARGTANKDRADRHAEALTTADARPYVKDGPAGMFHVKHRDAEECFT
jgi:hypothetical protein